MPCTTMREGAKERGPLDGSLRSRPDLTFFHAFAALSRNITEFTAVFGALPPQAPSRRVQRDANDMVDTLCCQRDTDFVGQDADDLTSWHVRIERWR